MNRFDYIRPDTVADAIKALSTPTSRILAGGTNLVDLMKYDVEKPACLVDINRLPLKEISPAADGGLRIGALVSNTDSYSRAWPALYGCAPWPHASHPNAASRTDHRPTRPPTQP